MARITKAELQDMLNEIKDQRVMLLDENRELQNRLNNLQTSCDKSIERERNWKERCAGASKELDIATERLADAHKKITELESCTSQINDMQRLLDDQYATVARLTLELNQAKRPWQQKMKDWFQYRK